jgi:predicted dehydrogenase
MKYKPNIGVIGAGMVAGFHFDAMLDSKRANVIWLADVDKRVLAEKQKKYDIPYCTTDYCDILNDGDIDAVIVSAPPFVHFDAAVATMRAGKNVLIEKPITVNRSQMNRLVRESQKHKKLDIMECSARHTRLQPKFRFVKRMLDNGDIGEVYHIHHNHLMRRTFIEYNPKGLWSLKKTLAGGGPFFDWGVYDLSFHLGLLNDKPKLAKIKRFARNGIKIFANTKIKSDVEEHGAAFMEFDTGLTYYYERGAGVHCEIPNETRIFGTKGSLRFAYTTWDSPEIEHFWVNKNRVEKRSVYKVDMSKHPGDDPALINHFIDCLAGKARPVMPVALAAKHLDILFRILGE